MRIHREKRFVNRISTASKPLALRLLRRYLFAQRGRDDSCGFSVFTNAVSVR